MNLRIKFTIFFIFICILYYLPFIYAAPLCIESGPLCNPERLSDCWDDGTEFIGKINNRYPIQMLLKWNDKHVIGYMFYESTAIYLFLEGTGDSKGHYVIKEQDKEGNNTGIFEGELCVQHFNGVWYTPDKKKQFPFELAAVPMSARVISGEYSFNIKSEYFSEHIIISAESGVIKEFEAISFAGVNIHDCNLSIENLKQVDGKSYILLIPFGEYELDSINLYGDRKDRIRIKETPDTICIQFFGYWGAACAFNAYFEDILYDKKTKKCKIIK